MKTCRHFQLIKFKNDLLRVIIRAELQHSADIELFRISHYVEIRKGKKKAIHIQKERAAQTQLSSSSSTWSFTISS